MRRLDETRAVTEGRRKVALSKDYYELVLTSNSISKRVKPPYLGSSGIGGGVWVFVMAMSEGGELVVILYRTVAAQLC